MCRLEITFAKCLHCRCRFSYCNISPSHLRPVTIEAVGRIFEISHSNPIRGKCGRLLSPHNNKALRRLHRATMRQMQTRKRRMRTMRLISSNFNVSGCRFRENLMSVIFLPPILGPALWAPGIFGFLLLENLKTCIPINFLVLGGGLFCWGAGRAGGFSDTVR